jgi:hypothetical protein
MFDICIIGDWSEGDIRCRWVPSTRRIVAEVETAIERAWQEAQRRRDVQLFDGPMCRLEAWRTRHRALELDISQTSYRVFLGTGMLGAALIDLHGREIAANPVGVSSILQTRDGMLMMGRRNARVAYYPDRVHPFAGSLEPGENVDVFHEVRRELAEELHITADDIEQITCDALVEDRALRQPELIFRVKCNLTRAQLEAQLDPKEHAAAWSAPATRDAVERALTDVRQFTPVAVAAMMIWGRSALGADWYERRRTDDG